MIDKIRNDIPELWQGFDGNENEEDPKDGANAQAFFSVLGVPIHLTLDFFYLQMSRKLVQ